LVTIDQEEGKRSRKTQNSAEDFLSTGVIVLVRKRPKIPNQLRRVRGPCPKSESYLEGRVGEGFRGGVLGGAITHGEKGIEIASANF